jgi:hypothetical protein
MQEDASVHTSYIKSLQKYHEADVTVIKAKAEYEKVEADIAARLAKFQAELNKLRVKAQAKVDQAVAEAEKANAEVRARENHREASKRYSERMTDWVRDKRKEVEVLRGWMAVDNVGVSPFSFVELADTKGFAEGTRGQAERVEDRSSRHELNPLRSWVHNHAPLLLYFSCCKPPILVCVMVGSICATKYDGLKNCHRWTYVLSFSIGCF